MPVRSSPPRRASKSFMHIIQSFSILLILLPCVRAASELRFNIGGFKLGSYESDPAAFVIGKSGFYRLAPKSGLSVGSTHRWARKGFVYEFPTENGQFDVDLIFAEVYPPAQEVGKRIFDVSVEDGLQLKNFDVFEEAGKDKEITKSFKAVSVEDGSLSIAFIPGPMQNPMVSAIVISKTDGSDIPIDNVSTGEGLGNNSENTGDFDHQSHAVAGGPYVETDFNNDGKIDIELDGTLSHSHYNNPDTGDSGRIVSYEWKVGSDIISTDPIFIGTFSVGVTEVTLTVKDQTGDTATAVTEVKALPSTAGGAYCYYYEDVATLPGNIQVGPKPLEGHASNIIDFDDDEFPFTFSNDDRWGARCLTDFNSIQTGSYTFTVSYIGEGAALYVKGVRKAVGGESPPSSPRNITATVTLGIGAIPIQILYYKNGQNSGLSLLVNDLVATPSLLGFKSSSIVPTISSISSRQVNPQGGGQLQIIGTGFFNGIEVSIGDAVPKFTKISSTELVINGVPSSEEAGGTSVSIIVKNRAGVSNSFELSYVDNGAKGVSWDQTHFKNSDGTKLAISQVSAITVGPDANYYVGSLAGFVTRLTVGKDLIVNDKCSSPSLGKGRAILGMAFNPESTNLRLYVSTNSLYWGFGGPLANEPDGWANGKIESLTGGCDCLCYEGEVVTGLPVSNHDHGISSLLFVDGDLLFSVGGTTNAGHNTPGNKLGGIPESPFSAAIVVARLSLGSAFDGRIIYDQYSNPETAKQISGDVDVYASGFRNCFGVTQHTNGQIWSTDNGGNFNYGDISTTCSTHVTFTNKQPDEINLVEEGKYYGHPNRNRGGGQCVFGAGEPPKATVPSSTNGVIEYTSNAFSGSLKSNLVFSKYAASGSGLTWSSEIKEDGSLNLIRMTEYSGLSIVNGVHGEIVMPRVQQGFIAVLKPKYSVPSGPMVIAVTPRRAKAGATVFISGENFSAGLQVAFGTTAASGISGVTDTGFFCTVPPGSGKVSVVVTVGALSSPAIAGFDFIYV